MERGPKASFHSCTVTSGLPFLNVRGRSHEVSCSSRLIVEFQLTPIPHVIGEQRFRISGDLARRRLMHNRRWESWNRRDGTPRDGVDAHASQGVT